MSRLAADRIDAYIPADEQQEAIKTLQRALDNIRYQQGQANDYDHSPQGSPELNARFSQLMESPTSLTIGLPTTSPLWLPDSNDRTGRRQSTATSHSSEKTDTSHLSVQAQKGESLPHGVLGDVDEMGRAGDAKGEKGDKGEKDHDTVRAAGRVTTRSAAVDKTDPRRLFIEKALDVSDCFEMLSQ